MNLIEALRTDRNIKSPTSLTFMRPCLMSGSLNQCNTSPGTVFARSYFLKDVMPYLCEVDLLRDDWEVEALTVTVTDTQFWKAYRLALEDYGMRRFPRGAYAPQDTAEIVQNLALNLGLSTTK